MYVHVREVLCAVMHPLMSRSESPAVSRPVCRTACNAV